MESKKNKKGKPHFRILTIIEDSPECEEAIKFMESLGVAYTLWCLPKGMKTDEKLPSLLMGGGIRFEGLEEIKRHRDFIATIFPGELIETEEEKKLKEALRFLRGE